MSYFTNYIFTCTVILKLWENCILYFCIADNMLILNALDMHLAWRSFSLLVCIHMHWYIEKSLRHRHRTLVSCLLKKNVSKNFLNLPLLSSCIICLEHFQELDHILLVLERLIVVSLSINIDIVLTYVCVMIYLWIT